jgi:hypothetical protein
MRFKELTEQELRHTVDVVTSVNGSRTEAGKILNLDRRTVGERMKLAAKRGFAPGHTMAGTAPGYNLKYLKVHRDADGMIKQTWECQEPDKVLALELFEAAVNGIVSRIEPAKPTPLPKVALGDLLTQYCFTDYHINMLAWSKEGGADWNIEIAKETAIKAMNYLVAGSPASGTGVVLIQGDWQHYDSLDPVTPTSRHVVDGSGRPAQGIDASMEVIELLVTLALLKHEQVILQICEGNHDLYTSMILRKMFSRLYRDEPRVLVPDEETPYYAIEFGKTALFYHHGHKKSWSQLPLTFADKFSEIWGRTKFRYGNTGHYHHEKREEFSGIKMLQHPTMAANDAHGSRGGYSSMREMSAITFHRNFGRSSELIVNPDMLQSLALKEVAA